jgi:hypothetical protein
LHLDDLVAVAEAGAELRVERFDPRALHAPELEPVLVGLRSGGARPPTRS